MKITYSELYDGDRILLCSDGLYNMVKPLSLQRAVNDQDSLAGKCQSLVEKAREQGGTDNITVIMAEVAGPGLPPADPAAEVQPKQFRESDLDR